MRKQSKTGESYNILQLCYEKRGMEGTEQKLESMGIEVGRRVGKGRWKSGREGRSQ